MAGEEEPPRPVPAKVQERLIALLPVEIAKTEFEAATESAFYTTDLYKYINGAAGAFHAYEFEVLLQRDYTAGDIEITVEIYDMGTPLNAFGIYSAEASPRATFLQIGAEANGGKDVLNFLQDRYYVKFSAFSMDDTDTAPLIEAFANAISESMKTGKKLPGELALFPTENLVAHTQKYVTKAPMGHAFLAPMFSAAYELHGAECGLMVSVAASPEEALERLGRLRAHSDKTGKTVDLPELGEHAFHATSPYAGELTVVAQDRYLVILKDPPEKSQSFLEKALERIAAN